MILRESSDLIRAGSIVIREPNKSLRVLVCSLKLRPGKIQLLEFAVLVPVFVWYSKYG